MIRSAVSALALALALSACAPSTQTAAVDPAVVAEQSAKLNEWFDAKYEEQMQFSPVMLTFRGRKDRQDEIDCFTFACQDELLAWSNAAAEELKATFNYEIMSPADKDSYDLWLYQNARANAGVPFRYNGYTFDQMNGPQSFLPTFLMQFHQVDDETAARAYVSRITAGARALREGLAVTQWSAARGRDEPRSHFSA
ncbi:MAG TPA: DUF885 domain-containing protein, partial [Hyphomonas sp.]|nr:DUF885 domain-containing protein [Hyphomonas sp.]